MIQDRSELRNRPTSSLRPAGLGDANNSRGALRNSILPQERLSLLQIVSGIEYPGLDRVLLIAQPLDDAEVIVDQAPVRIIGQRKVIKFRSKRVSQPYC